MSYRHPSRYITYFDRHGSRKLQVPSVQLQTMCSRSTDFTTTLDMSRASRGLCLNHKNTLRFRRYLLFHALLIKPSTVQSKICNISLETSVRSCLEDCDAGHQLVAFVSWSAHPHHSSDHWDSGKLQPFASAECIKSLSPPNSCEPGTYQYASTHALGYSFKTHFAVCNRAHTESTTLLVANHYKSVSIPSRHAIGFPDLGKDSRDPDANFSGRSIP